MTVEVAASKAPATGSVLRRNSEARERLRSQLECPMPFKTPQSSVHPAGIAALAALLPIVSLLAAPPASASAPRVVVLGFDGSFNGDATALVVCMTGDLPHLDVVRVWERPAGARPEWQVPILDVEEAIRAEQMGLLEPRVEGGKAVARQVTTGIQSDDLIEIYGDLREEHDAIDAIGTPDRAGAWVRRREVRRDLHGRMEMAAAAVSRRRR